MIGTKDPNLSMETMILWVNCNLNFIWRVREFTKIVSKNTETPLAHVEIMFSKGLVVKKFALMYREFLDRIMSEFKQSIKDGLSPFKKYSEFDAREVMENFINYFRNLIQLLSQKNQKTLLWNYIFDIFTTEFSKMVGRTLAKWPSGEKDDFIVKLDKDVEFIFQFLDPKSMRTYRDSELKLRTLVGLFKDPPEALEMHVINMKLPFMEGIYTKDMIKNVLKFRKVIDRIKKRVNETFQDVQVSWEKARNPALEMQLGVFVLARVKKFVAI